MKKILTLTILALLIVACTPAESGQPAELPTAESTSESAVNPVEEPVDNSITPDVTTVAPAGSVDLGQLTPEPPSEGDGLIVQPAPGVPNPEVKMVQLASQDLADRLGIDIGEVTLAEAVAQEWPDSSLGCPSPDLIYAAVITPGFEITLEAEGQDYSYHTDMVETVVLCVDGQPAE